MGYMAYLLTSWNYFLEETQQLAVANYLKHGDNTRVGSKGVFETSAGANTTRGAAWAIRALAQATTITPDADVMHSGVHDEPQRRTSPTTTAATSPRRTTPSVWLRPTATTTVAIRW